MTETVSPHTITKHLPIVHLNGFPGTGKLTIATKLAAQLNTFFDDITKQLDEPPRVARTIHNHLLIDPADAVLHRTQPGYQTLRKALRDAVFSSLANESSTFPTTYILTDWQSGDKSGTQVCEDIKKMAKARGSELVPVIIKCDEEENVRRLTSADRSRFSKITDVGLLLQFRQQDKLTSPVFEFDGHENRIEVDVTALSAEEAAAIIFKHVLQYIPEGRKYVVQTCG